MTQPDHVPITESEKVRPLFTLPAPEPWTPSRPAELRGATQPEGPRLGSPGPDQGYALTLAARFADELVLATGEHAADALAGATAVALRRAALFGRAPVVYDLEHALTLWGFLDDAPEDLVAFRAPLFRGAAEDYWARRAIAHRVPEATLRLAPGQVADRLGDWRELLGAG